MTEMKLGRHRPISKGPHLKFARYMRGLQVTPPSSVDYAYHAMDSLSNMYCNDRLSCCVAAGIAHLVGLFTANAGNGPTIFTDDQIIKLYSAISGYDPGNLNSDRGTDEVTALNYWQQHGAVQGMHPIAGWLSIDPTDENEVKQAMWLFENLFFGIELPSSWLNPPRNGFVWNRATPNMNNGHCVVGCGFTDKGVQVSTWGMVGTITWDAMKYDIGGNAGGELYAVISQDAIAKASQKTPAGISWAQMVADFDAIGGHVPLVTPTSPVVIPPITPKPLPTKQQILNAIDAALDGLQIGK